MGAPEPWWLLISLAVISIVGAGVREWSRRATLRACLREMQPGTALIDRRADGSILQVRRGFAATNHEADSS